MANLEKVAGQIEIIRGDPAEAQTLRAAVQGVELLFHQADPPGVPHGGADPLAGDRPCASGTLQVLLAAHEAGVRRVISAAGSSVYGNLGQGPRREDNPPRPVSRSAIAKLSAEQYCQAFTRMYGLETVRLRHFSVFGPRQSSDGPNAAVIPVFLKTMLAGQRPTIYGDGLQSRDFTYVEDVVQANLLAADARRVSGKVYNIGCGRRTTVLELVALINELLGTRLKPIYAGPRFAEVRHSLADTSLAQVELGFCPCTDLKHGLQRCIDWLRTQHQVREGATKGGRDHVLQTSV
jgi:UDP-glucose 4-epimerase